MVKNDTFIVEGGHRLKGEIQPQGAKNEALQILSAVLLSKEKIIVSNLPAILDVKKLIKLLKGLGVKVRKLGEGKYSFKADQLDLDYINSPEYRTEAGKIRGSVMFLGPLLVRFGQAYVPRPGGDKIGRRRIDTHLLAFEKLGAKFKYSQQANAFMLTAPKGLKGAYVWMEEISVTGTANIILASVLAKGTTTIYNAACEPYIQQLCKMLVGMGAIIEGIGSNLLTITGVQELGGTEHRLLADMIEVGSFIGMAAITQSEITIKNADVHELGIIPTVFRKFGVKLRIKGNDIFVPAQKKYTIQTFVDGSILTVYDAPWPGLTPDLISILLVMATQAKGSVLIHQKMFESRLFFVDKLIDMGAKIILCDPHRATVIGINREYPLRGINMVSPDIRAGVSLLMAAMSAEGTSVIKNIHQIDRGYQNIDGRLNAIGAKIIRH
ncbi:MAG TPA: UDP-N-acetylglucosamine 1-carboxyvinyltransferase [Saprospiraceae bacterium]|nr:UDP-N-acetylglucosamine 1-carboxyvinyltransferase [Saprospiraceae bacterium]